MGVSKDQHRDFELGSLELGESRLKQLVAQWRREQDEAPQGFGAWLASFKALHLDLGLHRETSSRAQTFLPSAFFSQRLEALQRQEPALLAEPHFLGWLHQYYHEPERARSFKAHTSQEAKHHSATLSTQLYTPRWMADYLILQGLEGWRARALPLILDPAMGAGQLLLAAADALMARWPRASALTIARALYGVDLDPLVVEVARFGLKLHLRRRLGPLDDEVLACIDAQLVQGDGLEFSPLPGPARYDLVVSNPPYMGARAMLDALKAQLKRSHRPFHADLYVAFMARALKLTRWRAGLLTQQTIWFLGSFEAARRALLELASLKELIHVGARAFGALTGEKAFVTMTIHERRADEVDVSAEVTRCLDLRGLDRAAIKRAALEAWLNAPAGPELTHETLMALPAAAPIYWLPDPLLRAFSAWPTLDELALLPGAQNKTGDNARYVKPWAEVEPSQLCGAEQLWDGPPDGRWRFYSKGGRYSPFWGNWAYVVDWSQEARAFYRSNRTSSLLDEAYWDREGLCYTDFGGQRFNARWLPRGSVFDMAGPAIFSREREPAREKLLLLALMALLNCSAPRELLNALNPSIHYQVRDLRRLPIPPLDDALEELAAYGASMMGLVRSLHELDPQDPLYRAQADASARDGLVRDLELQWSQLEALTSALYQVEPGELPSPMHHLLT